MQSLWMVVAGLSFALMGVFVKYGAEQFSAAELVFYRSFVQTVFALAVLWRMGISPRTARLGMHAHRGVAGFVSLFMLFYALTTLPVATAMTLNYTSPVFLTLLLAWFAREKPRLGLIGTVAVGFIGCGLLLQPTFSAGTWWPALIGLMSGAISSIAYWNVRELVRSNEPEARVVFYFGLFSVLGSLVWMAPQTWHPITLGNVGILLGVGFFGGAAQLAMTRAYGKGSTLVSAALSYSTILFSSILAIVLWGDVLPAIAWIGMLLIALAGIIAVQLQPGAHKDPAPQIIND